MIPPAAADLRNQFEERIGICIDGGIDEDEASKVACPELAREVEA